MKFPTTKSMAWMALFSGVLGAIFSVFQYPGTLKWLDALVGKSGAMLIVGTPVGLMIDLVKGWNRRREPVQEVIPPAKPRDVAALTHQPAEASYSEHLEG